MNLIVTVTMRQEGRCATSVDDFFYRDYDMSTFPHPKGTGVRGLAAKFIREGKMVARYVCLLAGGNALQTVNIFTSEEAYHEFSNHPIARAAKELWKERGRIVKKEIVPYVEILDVGNL